MPLRNMFPPAARGRWPREIVVPVDLPPAAPSPAQPSPGAPEQGIYVRLAGANFPPAGAIPVDEPADANLAPSTTTTILTYLVPDGERLRVEGIGFGATDRIAAAFMSWGLWIDSDPVPGYRSQPAAVGSLRSLAKIFVVVPGSCRLNVVVTISANAVLTYRYTARICGWRWQEREGH